MTHASTEVFFFLYFSWVRALDLLAPCSGSNTALLLELERSEPRDFLSSVPSLEEEPPRAEDGSAARMSNPRLRDEMEIQLI